MEFSTTVLIAAGVGAAAGAGVGASIGKVMNLSGVVTIASALLFAIIAAGGGAWTANHDLLPREKYDAARKAGEALPEVQVLRQYYPADYAALQTSLEANKAKRLGATGVNQLIRAQVNATLLREARKASDDNLVLLMTLRRDKAQALSQKSVAYCYDYLRGGRLTFDPDTAVDPAIVAREKTASAAILRQTATAPVVGAPGSDPNPRTMAGLQAQARDIELRDGLAAGARAGFPEEDQATIKMLASRGVSLSDAPRQSMLCRYNIILLNETLKLTPAQTALVYRMNLAKGL
jgi:hypothetical protein